MLFFSFLFFMRTFGFAAAYYAHGAISYDEASRMLPMWSPPPSSVTPIDPVRRLAQARTVLSAASIAGSEGVAVVQADDEGRCNLFLLSLDEETRVSTLRACLWHLHSPDRHVALDRLREWHSSSNHGWSMRFGAQQADALEWMWQVAEERE